MFVETSGQLAMLGNFCSRWSKLILVETGNHGWNGLGQKSSKAKVFELCKFELNEEMKAFKKDLMKRRRKNDLMRTAQSGNLH